MTKRPIQPDATFQRLMERSDEVFREFRRIAISSHPDIKAMAELTAEGQQIAAEMALIVQAKRSASQPTITAPA